MIDKLNTHYSFTSAASVYDEEALTALELAGRQSAKINEIIAAQNALDRETNTSIKDMKEKQIPETVEDTVLQHIVNGSFAKDIEENLGDLYARVDNLTKTIETGGTTGDAELLDLRIGSNGTEYGNAGTAVRKQFENFGIDMDFCGQTVRNLANGEQVINVTRVLEFKTGYLTAGTDELQNLPNYAYSDYMQILGTPYIIFDSNTYEIDVHVYDHDKNLLLNTAFVGTSPLTFAPKTERAYVRVVMRRKDKANFTSAAAYAYMRSEIENRTLSRMDTITARDWQSKCPNLDELMTPGVYKFLFGAADTSDSFPAGFPFATWVGGVATVIVSGFDYDQNGEKYYCTQTILTQKGIYYRYCGYDWSAWNFIGTNENNVVKVNNGGSILKGVIKAYEIGAKRVVVESGNYDVISEYKNHFGNTYFDNYAGYQNNADKFTRGIWLENIEVVFAPGAYVTAHYTGSNNAVKEYFSAFATGNNVLIEGLHLRASNLRYGVHPDFNSGIDRTFMTIRKCNVGHQKTSNNNQAFGCGLGRHVDWTFEDCVFVSYDTSPVLKIHNNENDDCCSTVTIKNCVVEGNGSFLFNAYSKSPHKTNVYVHNTKIPSMVISRGKVTSDSTDNINIVTWGNTY